MATRTIYGMSLYKVGSIWYYYITVDGKRYRESTGETDKRRAQEVHDRIKYELQRQGTPDGFTLADALRIWLTDKERTNKEKSAVRVLLRVYPSRPISEIAPHEIIEALQPRANSTINRTISIINAAIALASERGKCKKLTIKKRDEEGKRLRFLTREEWETLYKELPPHLKAIALFAIETGLRQANVLGLTWNQVNIKNRLVWVDAVDAKGKKAITVPLSKRATALLRLLNRTKKNEYVFLFNDKPVKSVKTAWNKALKRAGIDNFTFHDLRHTWASWHVQKGTPLMVLKELGGWADISMVQRYAHLSPDHLRQWV